MEHNVISLVVIICLWHKCFGFIYLPFNGFIYLGYITITTTHPCYTSQLRNVWQLFFQALCSFLPKYPWQYLLSCFYSFVITSVSYNPSSLSSDETLASFEESLFSSSMSSDAELRSSSPMRFPQSNSTNCHNAKHGSHKLFEASA